MKWFEPWAHLLRTRGAAAVWELSAVAAITPYIVGPMFAGGKLPDVNTSPAALAISLAVTLALLLTLRAALALTWDPSHGATLLQRLNAEEKTRADQQETDSQSGMLTRERLRVLVDDHDASSSQALLGLVRFANCPAMAAYHAEGARRVMNAFANRLEGAVGTKRPVGRLDDDTFAIWFSDSVARDALEAELKSIAYVLAQEIEDGELVVAPDIHLAAAWRSSNADTYHALLGAAQASLAPLKRFVQAANSRAPHVAPAALSKRFAIEQALRRAVREDQLSLRYQPFVDTSRGAMAGAEVLLRWRHPTFGDLAPTYFVPLLEETGLVHDIGLWTLNSACRQLSEWRTGGLNDFRLAINLSAIQLQNHSLKQVIDRTVAAHGLSPADVELELTETAAMENRARTIALFRELREQGFGIAIDDFGNGHSNLGYLKSLPFTKLKIDREFVSRVDSNAGSQAICKALIELGAGFGISVLAEGVERFEEVATLQRLGCHVFQGFYFSHPLTADDFTARLADQEWLALIGSSGRADQPQLKRAAL